MVKRVFVLVSLVVAILVIVGNGFAQDKALKSPIPNPSLGPEWKLLGTGHYGTTFYVDTGSITYLPKGIVKVWSLLVPRGEWREVAVVLLKMDLAAEGKDPNNAKRFWYIVGLDKINCRTHQYASLERRFYSFEKTVLYSNSLQYEKWGRIDPGSPEEAEEKFVCKSEPPIPEPSLSSKWKLVSRYSDGTTVYVNTRSITHLPKGIVKVRTLWVQRGKWRRKNINALKTLLFSEGKDPNNAERLWYEIQLVKVNCKKHQIALLETTAYSFEKAVFAHYSFQHEEWDDIVPGSVGEKIEKYVCK